MLSLTVNTSQEDFPQLTEGQLSKATRSIASRVRKLVIGATPKDTGEARKSWTGVRKIEGGYSFISGSPYIGALEYGSEPGQAPWPRPREKTVLQEGRIYSKQAPGGITENADIDAAINDIVGEVLEMLFGSEGSK